MKEITAELVRPLIKKRPLKCHKRDFGKLGIVAGSKGMCGAALLCGRAAMRSGVGLTTFIANGDIRPVLQIGFPEATVIDKVEELIPRDVTAFAVGPGLGSDRYNWEYMKYLYQSDDRPIVVDADGLNDLVRVNSYNVITTFEHSRMKKVITPHEGEAARLLNVDKITDREETVVALAKRIDGIALLKGHETLISDGEEIYKNTTGNPGMATGGSGDVLTGMIGALLAQGYKPLEAALIGCYIHGLAGDFARDEMGEISLIAGDIIDNIPKAFKSIT